MTSLIKFLGEDYELAASLSYIVKYCQKCIKNNVLVDFYCPNVKIFDSILLSFNILNKLYKHEPKEDYSFIRVIEESRSSYVESAVYAKSVCRSLKLEFIDHIYLTELDWQYSNLLDGIKKGHGKRAFNIVSFSENFFNQNTLDLNISIVNLYNTNSLIYSLGSADLGGKCIKFNNLNLFQIFSIMSCSNMFFGQDSLLSQMALSVGIPCYVISNVGGTCKIKQNMENAIYGKRAHLSPVTIKKINSKW